MDRQAGCRAATRAREAKLSRFHEVRVLFMFSPNMDSARLLLVNREDGWAAGLAGGFRSAHLNDRCAPRASVRFGQRGKAVRKSRRNFYSFSLTVKATKSKGEERAFDLKSCTFTAGFIPCGDALSTSYLIFI